MGFTSRDSVVSALQNARVLPINKASVANMLAGGFASLWRATGTPAQGAIPGAAAVCTDALTGSLGTIAAPGSGQVNALLRGALACASAGVGIQIVDRLAHMGGLSGTTATPTAQTANVNITSLAGTRCRTDYADVAWWLEIYADIGTTGVTATIAYTDSGGGSRTTTVTGFGGASPANRASRIFPIIPAAATPLAPRSVESVTLSATTGTAGSFGVTATRLIADLALPPLANYARDFDWAALGLPPVHEDACLALQMLCTTTSTGIVAGSMLVGAA